MDSVGYTCICVNMGDYKLLGGNMGGIGALQGGVGMTEILCSYMKFSENKIKQK